MGADVLGFQGQDEAFNGLPERLKYIVIISQGLVL
jgi:hypothetical protein